MTSMLNQLQTRFPDEGHFHYLEALREDDSDRRRERLKRCLQRTPYHRAALLAVDFDFAEGKAARQLLSPGRSCDVRFGDALRLYGYELERPASGEEAVVYLTVYWEVLSPVSVPLTTEVIYEGKALTWFLGAESRPTHQWKVGEAVVETVRLPLSDNKNGLANSHDISRSFSLKIGVYPYWDLLHSGWNNRPFLRASGKNAADWASLGEFQWENLPRALVNPLAGKRASPQNFRLFDLIRDPMELRDVRREQPRIFAKLHRQFLELTNRLVPSNPAIEPMKVELSDEKLEQLRALGYVE